MVGEAGDAAEAIAKARDAAGRLVEVLDGPAELPVALLQQRGQPPGAGRARVPALAEISAAI